MLNVKNAVTRILVGAVILMTFSACETTKQGRVMSAEDVREQLQVSSGGDVDVSDGRSMDEPVISIEEFGSSDFIPETLPIPTFHDPELPEAESEIVAFEPTPPTRVLPTLPLEFPKGNRSPASDYVPELPPQANVEAEPYVLTKDDIKDDVKNDSGTPVPPPAPEVPDTDQVTKDSKLEHVFFGFDQYSIRQDAVPVLEKNAEMLNGLYKGDDVLIEGHCDERGTTDYNVELGKRRAQAVKDYLVDLGVTPSRIRIVSYGKERPFCRESKPACWQKNRRAHFVLQ